MENGTVFAAAIPAIDVLKSEHHSLGGVLHLLRHLLRDIAAQHTEPDFALIASALYYIDEFASRCHHPREDRYLFAAVRSHVPGAAGAIDSLQAEHQRDAHYVRELHRLFVLYQAGAPDALKRLCASLDIYASMLFDHMRREEALLETHGGAVPAGEWREFEVAFAAESDPLAGAAREFARLRERITNLLPRKMRFGPADS
jgi:hemerythrin-like domain-containing protein